MNHSKQIFIPLAAIAVSSLSYGREDSPALDQTLKDPIGINLAPRSAIPTQPIARTDRKGRTYSPDEKILLPNGRTMAAKDYFDGLDRLEAKLNQSGFTLRNGGQSVTLFQSTVDPAAAAALQADLDGKIAPGTVQGRPLGVGIDSQKAVSISASDFDTSALTAQSKTHLTTAISAINAQSLKADQQGNLIVDVPSIASLMKGKAGLDGELKTLPRSNAPSQTLTKDGNDQKFKNFTQHKWNPHAGPFALDCAYSLTVEGLCRNAGSSFSDSKTSVSGKMEGDVNVTVWKLNKDILKFDTTYKGSQIDGNSFTANLYVDGNKIWGVDNKLGSTKTITDTYSLPWDYSVDFEFPILPGVSLMGRVGTIGAVGINFNATITDTSAHAETMPFVKATAYADAGVGLGIEVNGFNAGATGGVKCNVLLLDERLKIGCNIGLAYDGRIGIQNEFYMKNKVDALNGSVDGYIQVLAGPAAGPALNWNLYKWGGLHQDSTLVDAKYFTPLNWSF